MFAFAALAIATLAQAPDTLKTLEAHRIGPDELAPAIDGRIDEPIWALASVATDFVQVEPNNGAPGTHPTEARILYDGDALYVAMRMFDPNPDSIAAQLGRRDQQNIYSDWAHVAVDSYDDNRTAFRFAVTPRGVQADAYHYDDSSEDSGWDAVWEAATTLDSLGWTAEFRIPLSQLRFRSGTGDRTWGIGFARDIARYGEKSLSFPMEPNSNRIVSSFGVLTGLDDLVAPRRLEVLPYTVAKVTRAPGDASDPYYSPTQPGASLGADLKYGLTSDFTLTATVNPDFGQVEADPAIVNLSAYETFLPERRPFFVEGMDIFQFGIGVGDGDGGNEQLFYSRRVGRQPQYSVNSQGGYVDAPDATTILTAGKISGKTGGGWSFGVLNAVTAREEARYVTGASSDEVTLTTEPLTNYGVLRGIKDFRGGRSALGGILTTTHRQLEDHLDFLPTASYTGGVDLRHRFGESDFEMRSWLLASHVEGDAAAIDRLQRAPARRFHRPDADHVDYDPTRTSLDGWAAATEIIKAGGGHWSYGGILNARSPGFDVNDAGFQRDGDMALGAIFAGYREYEPGPLFRNWRVGANQWYGTTFGGENIAHGGNVNGNLELNNFWGAYGGLNVDLSTLSPGALRGGPAIIEPGSYNTFFGMYSDSRERIRFSLNGNARWEHGTAGGSWNIGPEVSVRASTRMDLSLRPSYSSSISAWQFVSANSLSEDQRYIFGRMDQRTASLTGRMSYTFTPRLSLQLYAQPFVSAGQFSDYRYVADPRARDFDSRLPVFAGSTDELEYDAAADMYRADLDGDDVADVRFSDPDFNVKQFRSNAVLRWEYRPGSTFFVVWSQGRQGFVGDGSFSPGRDFGRLFGMDDDFNVPATNVLLVKFNYWLDI
jgi:hypothetical protein